MPGRFMFDLAHWRSEFRVFGAGLRALRALRPAGPDGRLPAAAGYWKGGKFTNPEVNYTLLPTTLQPRDPATDPIWPFRSLGDFYVGNQAYSANGVNLEFISLENHITRAGAGALADEPGLDRRDLDARQPVPGLRDRPTPGRCCSRATGRA